MSATLPLFVRGTVVQGFGRGSKQLGCPTANFSRRVVDALPESLPTGVYCGWASVDGSPVYKMVMNVGWCPYYDNEQKSMETHILHEFADDFYGADLKVCVAKYLRPERNFSSLEELRGAIERDIRDADEALNDERHSPLKSHKYLIEK